MICSDLALIGTDNSLWDRRASSFLFLPGDPRMEHASIPPRVRAKRVQHRTNEEGVVLCCHWDEDMVNSYAVQNTVLTMALE